MERYCGCFDNKYECGFVLLVVLFISVLCYNDSRAVAVNGRQGKRQVHKHCSTDNNHKNKNKHTYRSPRETGTWRNNSVALFGMSLDEWNNVSRDITLASNIPVDVAIDASTEQRA